MFLRKYIFKLFLPNFLLMFSYAKHLRMASLSFWFDFWGSFFLTLTLCYSSSTLLCLLCQFGCSNKQMPKWNWMCKRFIRETLQTSVHVWSCGRRKERQDWVERASDCMQHVCKKVAARLMESPWDSFLLEESLIW